jgi:hypothetical protein
MNNRTTTTTTTEIKPDIERLINQNQRKISR